MQQLELQCQSCGMPLNDEGLFGTDLTGGKEEDYCKYCYEKGEFTQPNFTMDDMAAFCVPILVGEGMEEPAARAIMSGSLPHLKRWSSPAEEAREVSYVIVEKEAIKLVGISAQTTNKQESTSQAKIGVLWGRFWGEGIQQLIPMIDSTEPQPVYGCYSDYENGASGEYKILAGCRVNLTEPVPEGLTATILPPSRYAVFTTRKGPVSEVVLETWQTIWKLSETPQLLRTFTGDFEVYDERSADTENAQVDIYIAI